MPAATRGSTRRRCTVAPCPFAAGDVPNIQRAGTSGAVGEGQTVLTNGVNVGARAGTPAAPGALAAGAKTLNVLAGQGLRLQMGSEATTRFFRLRLTDNAGVQIPLVRVGGQGGLLDHAQVEGGVVAGYIFKYDAGEILIDPGDRADIVVAIPAGAAVGDKLTLWTQDFERTGMGFAKIPTVPVAHFNVTGTAGSVYTIAAGTPLRAATGDLVEVLPAATGTLLDPTTFTPPKDGMPSQDIRLTNTGSDLGIDGFHGDHDFPGIDYTEIEHPDSTRYAELGDTLELTVTNVTDAHHPFHLHGFSIQPIELTHASLSPYLFPYHEFKDNIDVPARYTLRFRVRLDDRFLMDGTTLGGGLGRWVFHCHIFFHASFGMISEFDVVAANGNEAPHVNSDFTSVEVVAGETATMTGTYFDVDGDAVTLESSIGTVTDTGGGTWSWSYPTTGAPNESQLVYVTATDAAGLKGQVAFSLIVGEIKSLKEDVLAQATALLPGPTAFDTKKLGELIVKLRAVARPGALDRRQPHRRQGREQGLRPRARRGQEAQRADQGRLDPGSDAPGHDRRARPGGPRHRLGGAVGRDRRLRRSEEDRRVAERAGSRRRTRSPSCTSTTRSTTTRPPGRRPGRQSLSLRRRGGRASALRGVTHPWGRPARRKPACGCRPPSGRRRRSCSGPPRARRLRRTVPCSRDARGAGRRAGPRPSR